MVTILSARLRYAAGSDQGLGELFVRYLDFVNNQVAVWVSAPAQAPLAFGARQRCEDDESSLGLKTLELGPLRIDILGRHAATVRARLGTSARTSSIRIRRVNFPVPISMSRVTRSSSVIVPK